MGCLKLSYYPTTELKIISDRKVLTYNKTEINNRSSYLFGFNGMENDDEIAGNDNALDFGARIYDARLGRWLGIDQASELFAAESPYLFAGCNPIFFIDNNGKWKVAWRDNNDHSNGIVLEAEPGDNLQTLAVQMGIPYQQLIDENFKGKDFTLNNPLNGGEWLRQEDLPGVETFQNINNWLKKDLYYLIEENLSSQAIAKSGLFNTKHVSKLTMAFLKSGIDEYSIMWKLLQFQMWYNKWI